MTILIRDRREKINSLMSRAVSLIKVLGRRRGGTSAEPWERDIETQRERERDCNSSGPRDGGMEGNGNRIRERLDTMRG